MQVLEIFLRGKAGVVATCEHGGIAVFGEMRLEWGHLVQSIGKVMRRGQRDLEEVLAEDEFRATGRHIDPWFWVSRKQDPPSHSRCRHFPRSQGAQGHGHGDRRTSPAVLGKRV